MIYPLPIFEPYPLGLTFVTRLGAHPLASAVVEASLEGTAMVATQRTDDLLEIGIAQGEPINIDAVH